MNKELIEAMYYQQMSEYFASLRRKEIIVHKEGSEHLNENVINPKDKRQLYVLSEFMLKSSMNIFSPKGEKVIYNGQGKIIKNLPEAVMNGVCENYLYDVCNNLQAEEKHEASKQLKEGGIYTIKACIAFQYFTLVELEELPGVIFTSNSFNRVNPERTEEQLIWTTGQSLN